MENNQRQAVFPVDYYIGYEKLNKIKNDCQSQILNIDWKLIEKYLRHLPKDSQDETPIRWMIHESTVDLEECSYEDNFTTYNRMISTIPSHVGHWLHLNFKVGNDIGFSRNEYVSNMFANLLSYIKEIPGLFHLGVNHISPNFWTPKHTDGYPGYITILITLKASINLSDKITLEVDSKIYNFENNDFFCFDPEFYHQAINLSDDDWIFITLRIEEKYFKGR